jgi:hypothetical protein
MGQKTGLMNYYYGESHTAASEGQGSTPDPPPTDFPDDKAVQRKTTGAEPGFIRHIFADWR